MTFYADTLRSDGTTLRGLLIEAPDMTSALRQLSAFEAGLAVSGIGLSIERISRSKSRGVEYEKGW